MLKVWIYKEKNVFIHKGEETNDDAFSFLNSNLVSYFLVLSN